jgi:hypothetical protein
MRLLHRHRIMNRIFNILCFVVLIAGCRTDTQQTIIARVGDAALTLEEVKAYIDTTRVPYNDQVRAYIVHWINDELIYQQAARAKIENDETFKARVSQAHRQLAIQTFLDKTLGNDSASISEQSVKAYFQAHAQEFTIEDDVLKLNLITFRTRERANIFAGEVQAGTPWNSAVAMVIHDSLTAAEVVSSAGEMYYTRQTIYPVDLWRVGITLGPGEISFPVKTSLGYSILQVLSSVRKGSPAEYDIIRNEVRERYIVEQRQRQFNELLKNLRQRYPVDISFTPASSDTATSISHD